MRIFEINVGEAELMALVDQAADLDQVRRDMRTDADMLLVPELHRGRPPLSVVDGADAFFVSGNGYTLETPRTVFIDAALHKASRAQWREV